MRPLPDRRRSLVPRLAASALLALGAGACADGPLAGPGLAGRGVSLRLEPRIEPRASVVAAGIVKVRVGIARVPDGLVVLDSVVDLAGQAAELDLAVPLASTNDRFAVRLAATDAAGDTIFRAADTTAVVRGSVARSLELLLRYAGPDTGVTRIVAGPDTAIVDAGASVPLWAVGYRPGAAGASPLAHLTWRSGDESVARVSRTGGQVTAVTPGRATWIYATTVSGLVDSAHVVVRPVLATLVPNPASAALLVGGSAPLSVAGRATDGAPYALADVTWATSNALVATVSPAGTIVAVGAGDATITASSDGAQVAIPVTVRRAAVTQVRVEPAAVALLRTTRAPLAATVTVETGATATDRPAVWTTSDGAIATVDADGVVTAIGVGTATITATVDGRSAMASIGVAALPANAIVASPTVVQLASGATLPLAVAVTDATGAVVDNAAVSWTSAAPGLVSVSSGGVVTALAAGTTTITASAQGRSSTVSITVLPVPVAAVVLSSGKLPLIVEQSFRFGASTLAANGSALVGRTVTWSSSTPATATVDANGLVTALGIGKTYVTATSEGVSTTVKVDVVPIPVDRVQLSAPLISLLVDGTYQLRADAYDSLGRLLPGRATIWSSNDPSIAGVANDGLITGKKIGNATITATIDGRSASASATIVAPAPVPAVVFTPGTGARYALGQTMTAQSVGVSVLAGSTTLQLASWNGSIASVQQAVPVTGTTPAPFTVTGRALGTVRLQGTSAVAPMATTDVTVVPATLRAVGWTGTTMRYSDYIRIRLEAGGTDGTSTDAVFAEATPFVLTFDKDTVEVYRDKYPTLPVGPSQGNHRDGQIDTGETIVPTPGERYVSLVIKARKVGQGTLTITAPGRYTQLDLRGLVIIP